MVFCDRYLPRLVLSSAVKMVSLMSKEYVMLKMEEKYSKPENVSDLFNEWAIKNGAYINEYRFLESVPKEEYKGVMIPTFSETDMTFTHHVVKKLSPDHSSFDELVYMWLVMIHKAESEISKTELDDEFVKLMQLLKKVLVDDHTLFCIWECQFRNILKIEELTSLRMHDHKTLEKEKDQLYELIRINMKMESDNLKVLVHMCS